MLTFKELENPAFGWRLERVRNTRALGLERYWEVALMRLRDGHVLECSHNNLRMAWESVVRAAENHDVLERAEIRTG